jgi:hypothetical protein
MMIKDFYRILVMAFALTVWQYLQPLYVKLLEFTGHSPGWLEMVVGWVIVLGLAYIVARVLVK